ncbi:peptidase M15B and M15C DD-carboxypeptidase VanY/endolysin [Jonesia denitrificans DSM 20603]|uniref:Peptidase M15B and M15C DD-carboxypeptidase VanY/endolysin n=2 Tax=Jonesia TaxID=43673 RepID=C7R1I7_JONDD|nr:peptidase M15B and M15C DD-carboxypeptidase VanY/endolysin [Jonesia denitrificans DSM 20603]SQH22465.1 D-alanyl-D-alanine carboxypeptidase [Jonesia denitrificans]
MGIVNGRIAAASLKSAVIGVRLQAGAANSANRLAKAFEAHFGKPLRATDGYRTYALQKKIFQERYDRMSIGRGPYGDVRWWNGGRWVRMRGAAAAVPGTSNHGLGLAVDFASGINTSFTSREYKWMSANAPAYGWTNSEGASVNEPWHWVYDSHKDTRKPKRAVKLVVDGRVGPRTYKEWQTQLGGLVTDGIFGARSIRRLQTRINGKDGKGGFKLSSGPLKVDGVMGARTVKAVQKLINVWAARKAVRLTAGPLKVDGILGPRTVKALQKTLNENLWN